MIAKSVPHFILLRKNLYVSLSLSSGTSELLDRIFKPLYPLFIELAQPNLLKFCLNFVGDQRLYKWQNPILLCEYLMASGECGSIVGDQSTQAKAKDEVTLRLITDYIGDQPLGQPMV